MTTTVALAHDSSSLLCLSQLKGCHLPTEAGYWRHSGFSVHNRVYVPAGDGQGLEALARYMMRSPISLSRLRFTPGSSEVVYFQKAGHDEREPREGEKVDAMDFVARILVQIPDGKRHLTRYYGAYSNVARGKRRKVTAVAEQSSPAKPSARDTTEPDGAYRAALRRRRAEMIRRIYQVDPLVCSRCGAEMRVVGFITEPRLITRILDHLRKRDRPSRAPPLDLPTVAAPA